jgi:hypothetical protein
MKNKSLIDMLHFFRRIRQNLLKENKVTRYLLYAIGEIVLVVIGILIALQVNNWNEERKQRAEEIEVLKSVKKGLSDTVAEFQFLNGIRDKVLYGTRGIYEEIGKGEVNKELLDSLMGLTFYRPTFNNKQGAIDLLFTSGKINLIQNDSIREMLLFWPGLIDDMVEEEGYATEMFVEHYYPAAARYINVDEMIEKVLSTSFFGTEIEEERLTALTFPNRYSAMFQDREFLNHLRMRATHMRITNGEVQDLILHASRLIAVIDNEINQ